MTTTPQHERVVAALTKIVGHVRVRDQNALPEDDKLDELVAAFPVLRPFADNEYVDVWAVLDWDHLLPSEQLFLRVFVAYDDNRREQLAAERTAVDERIEADNLHPEFDVPDYGDLSADELYIATYDPTKGELGELQFSSAWRRQVPGEQLEIARKVLEQSDGFKTVLATRDDDGLGAAMFVGWVPPCIAHAESWALEFWLLMRFDGSTGEASVFVVDPENRTITRQYVAEVQAS